MPGITPENIDISVTDDVLTLHGERHTDKEVSEEDCLMHETSWGSAGRTMRLPEGTDIDDISADFHDGILEVTVPKAAERATRTRMIQVAAQDQKKLKDHHQASAVLRSTHHTPKTPKSTRILGVS
jgi:HSP20 family protein